MVRFDGNMNTNLIDNIYFIIAYNFQVLHWSSCNSCHILFVTFVTITDTVKPLKTDTPREEQKCPSYRGVRLIEVIFNRNLPLRHR